MTEKVKQHAAPVTGSDEIDIGRLVGTVVEAKWWVIGITAVFAVAAIAIESVARAATDLRAQASRIR